jgi:hypothetical protein
VPRLLKLTFEILPSAISHSSAVDTRELARTFLTIELMRLSRKKPPMVGV